MVYNPLPVRRTYNICRAISNNRYTLNVEFFNILVGMSMILVVSSI